jgi:hypothetical protein
MVGVFLAAVAYWYRTPAQPPSGDVGPDAESVPPTAGASANAGPL